MTGRRSSAATVLIGVMIILMGILAGLLLSEREAATEREKSAEQRERKANEFVKELNELRLTRIENSVQRYYTESAPAPISAPRSEPKAQPSYATPIPLPFPETAPVEDPRPSFWCQIVTIFGVSCGPLG